MARVDSVNVSARANSVNKSKERKINSKGTLAALGVGTVAQTVSSLPSLVSVKGMTSISHNLSKDQVEIVNHAADEVVANVTNLGKKGVTIQDFTFAGINFTDIPDFILELINPIYATAHGNNAFFTDELMAGGLIGPNTVVLNRDKLSLAAFHELGHAFNANNSAFWKGVQKMRVPGMLLATAFMMLPVFTKETKAEDDKELSAGQKFKNGLRKASPALAFASMLPMLGEEAMASIRGCKWAKQLLDKNLFKKVLKTNTIAYTSYLAAALSFAVAAFAARKVKDNYTQKKQEAVQQQAPIENKAQDRSFKKERMFETTQG